MEAADQHLGQNVSAMKSFGKVSYSTLFILLEKATTVWCPVPDRDTAVSCVDSPGSGLFFRHCLIIASHPLRARPPTTVAAGPSQQQFIFMSCC